MLKLYRNMNINIQQHFRLHELLKSFAEGFCTFVAELELFMVSLVSALLLDLSLGKRDITQKSRAETELVAHVP